MLIFRSGRWQLGMILSLVALLAGNPLRAAPLDSKDIEVRSVGRDGRVSPQNSRLSDITQGRAVVMMSWATWSGISKQAVPVLQSLVEQRKGKVLLVLALIDPRAEKATAEISAALRTSSASTQLVLHDATRVSSDPIESSAPYFRVFTSDGRSVAQFPGFDRYSEPFLDQVVEAAVQGRTDVTLSMPGPGSRAYGTVGAAECGFQVLVMFAKKWMTADDWRTAVFELAAKKGVTLSKSRLPAKSDHPEVVKFLTRNFEWVDTSRWSFSLVTGSGGTWLRNSDLREGDVIPLVADSKLVLITPKEVRVDDPIVSFHLVEENSPPPGYLELLPKQSIIELSEGDPNNLMVLRPKLGASCN
jgi:hypothetical protein